MLGAIVPSSGPFAEWGRTNTATLQMLEKQVNDAGGINGAKLRILILDDATKPAQATNNLRKLAGDDHVLAVAGPLTSSAAEVTFPVANEMKVVATSQASSKPGVAKLNRPWAFRNTIDEGVLGRTTVPYFKKAFSIKTVAIIFDAKDATAATVGSKIMPGLMKDNGIEVLNANDPLSFNTGDLDVSAQVTKIKALNPDGVVVSADYSQAVTVHPRDEAPGRHQAGGRRDATDFVGDPESRAGDSDRGAGDVLRQHGRRQAAEIRQGADADAAQDFRPAGRDRADRCTTPTSMRSPASISKPIKKAGVTGKPEDLEADRTKIRDYMAKLTGFAGSRRADRVQRGRRRHQGLLYRAGPERRVAVESARLQRARRQARVLRL